MLFPSAVCLTCEEQATLDAMIHRGRANARTVTRARILLKSADGRSTAAIAEALDVVRRPLRTCGGASRKAGWKRSCTIKSSSTAAARSLDCRRPI